MKKLITKTSFALIFTLILGFSILSIDCNASEDNSARNSMDTVEKDTSKDRDLRISMISNIKNDGVLIGVIMDMITLMISEDIDTDNMKAVGTNSMKAVEFKILLVAMGNTMINAGLPTASIINVITKIKAEAKNTTNKGEFLALLNKYTDKWKDSGNYDSTSINTVVEQKIKEGMINPDTLSFKKAESGAEMFLSQNMEWCNFLKDLNNINNSNIRIYASTMNIVNRISN